MFHGKYSQFPKEEKSKPSVYLGLKKLESNDYMISKEIEKVRNNTNTNFMKGCVTECYYFMSNNGKNITSNNDCNTELEQELNNLRNELNCKRENLNDALKSFPYGSLVDKSFVRFDRITRWFCKTCGCLASMLFLFVFWISIFIEMMLCFPIYAIIDKTCSINPTQSQIEQWYQNNIASNVEEFDTEKHDDFLVKSLHKICSKLNEKYSRYRISLKPFTYVDTIDIESHDKSPSEGGYHVNHHTVYWDEFLVINESNSDNA